MRLCLHIVTRIMLINATSSLDTKYKNRSMTFLIMLACSLLFRTSRTQALRVYFALAQKIHFLFFEFLHVSSSHIVKS